MYYDSDVDAKTELCGNCILNLVDRGVRVSSVEALLDWMSSAHPVEVVRLLYDVGFQRCYYDNRVDDAFQGILDATRGR